LLTAHAANDVQQSCNIFGHAIFFAVDTREGATRHTQAHDTKWCLLAKRRSKCQELGQKSHGRQPTPCTPGTRPPGHTLWRLPVGVELVRADLKDIPALLGRSKHVQQLSLHRASRRGSACRRRTGVGINAKRLAHMNPQ